LKDEIWIFLLAVGLFPTAVWYLLKWLGAPKSALSKPVLHALWALAALVLVGEALSLIRAR
jgi:hypothetical protein